MSVIRTRFAPSPTGKLHLGHILAAQVARSLAKPEGMFLLRHEDIDGTRVREEYYQGIEDDLRWLGLVWDGIPLRQTTRIPAYEEAFQKLLTMKALYPCFCTRREIQEEQARMANAPHGSQALYPGTCRKLTATERQEKIAAGIPHAWRLDAAHASHLTGPLTFYDLRHGLIPVDAHLLGDVVLARKDIGIAYHLAVVVDDAYQEITHVTRGEDLLESTHVHRLLQTLLDLSEPIYLHHPLLLDEHGKRLAKRDEAMSIQSLREKGMSPEAVLQMLPASALKGEGRLTHSS